MSESKTITVIVPDDFMDTDAFRRVSWLVIALLMSGMSPDIILRRLMKEPDHTGVVL